MKQKTYYHLILDRSGSMQQCANEAVASFNEQVQALKQMEKELPGQEIRVSLTLFNHKSNLVILNQKPSEIRELTQSKYSPDGMTALYDAMGYTLSNLQETAGKDVDAGIATVHVVVITDGHENASTTYDHASITSKIARLTATEKWTVSYLSEVPDRVEVAKQMQIDSNDVYAFNKSNYSRSSRLITKSLQNILREKESEGAWLNKNFLANNEED
jgi:Mg-chelatase subunit ChlD